MARHRLRRRVPRWIGLTVMALGAVVFSLVLAPLIARADVMPPGPIPVPVRTTCAAQTATWSTADQSNPVMAHASVVRVRAGRHACFDRLVFHVNGAPGGWGVRYVAQVTADASGLPVHVAGAAFLEVAIRNPGIDGRGNSTLRAPLPQVGGFPTLRDLQPAGAFEGVTSFGVGLSARVPFRVFALVAPGDGMIVLDVAHPNNGQGAAR